MKAGLEIYISIVVITIMAILCMNFIVADVNVSEARDAYYAYYEQIDNSHCSTAVANACIDDAGENGYDLKIEKVGDADEPMLRLTFIYHYKVTMLGINKQHSIVGYIQE